MIVFTYIINCGKKTKAQVAQRGFGISIVGDTQTQLDTILGSLLQVVLLEQGLDEMTSRAASHLSRSVKQTVPWVQP